MKKIEAERIETNGFLKYLFVGNFIAFLVLWLCFTLLGIFSDNINLSFNGEVLTTTQAILYSPLAGLFCAIPFSVVTWISITIGFWGWSKFKPLVVEYEPITNNEE